MRTAVVILNWNTEGFLRTFLPGLLRSVEQIDGAEIVVADNASTDGSLKVMAKEFPQVKTIVFDRNLGFTGGYNKAFTAIDCEYFVQINSDIVVADGWLEPLIDWMDTHLECGACAPKLHSWQERDKFEYAGAAGGYIDKYGYPFCRGRVLKKLETDRGQYDSPTDVFWATGACLMVRSKVFADMGGLDDRFFAHMEEIDLCWRMQLCGYKVTVVPGSVVYHVGGGTLPASSPFKLRLNYRNNLLMLANNLAKTYALQLYKKGMGTEKAALKGIARAGRLICFRQGLDWLSAAVYLLTFNIGSFKAVYQAHKEYKEYRGATVGAKDIIEYLRKYGDSASVTGIYNKWIILQSMLYGKKIFRKIDSGVSKI